MSGGRSGQEAVSKYMLQAQVTVLMRDLEFLLNSDLTSAEAAGCVFLYRYRRRGWRVRGQYGWLIVTAVFRSEVSIKGQLSPDP